MTKHNVISNQLDNCRSQSEFIKKEIWFYYSYISAEEGVRFLPAAITSVMTGMVNPCKVSRCGEFV